jgi:hypothetical protein
MDKARKDQTVHGKRIEREKELYQLIKKSKG